MNRNIPKDEDDLRHPHVAIAVLLTMQGVVQACA
jgi:hypothetical protein